MLIFKRLLFIFFVIVLINNSNVSAREFGLFRLLQEPTIRIGLETNARSVAISTIDSSLVAVSPGEQNRFLATPSVTVTARAYRPPEIEIYRFEIPGFATQAEAEAAAADVRRVTSETAAILLDARTNRWRVRIGDKKETIEEANEYKASLLEKGFGAAEIVTEKLLQPSTDAVILSQQLKTAGKSEVRSLIKTTGSSTPTSSVPVGPAIDANLREVIVSGASSNAKFTSLKSVAFGSMNERAVPVRVNGKAYRGRIEVFVNSRGTLTIVNVVSLEDYMLGVVPNELSLPAIEAQKAQAVAARTYAVANINQFGKQGFDLLPTTRSQVYEGYSSESKMGTQAVMETRGLVATYQGKPINALYTSTCGGRTENSENIFDFNEPYLRGVECSIEARRHFDPFLVKSARLPAKLRDERNLELVRLMSLYAVNGFQLTAPQMNDDWFEDTPTQNEFTSWLNQLAVRFGKPYPAPNKDNAKPAEFAGILAGLIYGEGYADTLLSEADINYQLSFDDAAEIPKDKRASMAILLRDGWFSIYPDMTIKPNKALSRSKILRIINQIYSKRKWLPALQTGITQAAESGKLTIKNGKTNRQLLVRSDVFLFRQFGDDFYQVRETALVGGETVNFQTNALGEVTYLEVKPATTGATADRMSSFSLWNTSFSPSAVESNLSRFVRGIGSLIDVRIARQGFSRRATDLEIIGTNGTFHLTGGKIRSALRLNEQLFVINKRYDPSGRVSSYSFTGRGWGHGVGMCQYGAYGLAKMGLKYDAILKHYYTGIAVTKAY